MAKIRTNRECSEERERRQLEWVMFLVIGAIFVVILMRACHVGAGSAGSIAERHVVRDLDRIAAAQERIAASLERMEKKCK